MFIVSTLILTAPLFPSISLSDSDAYSLGMRVWKNESGKTIKGLTWWNENEDFASMGIGHFIWFPKDQKKNYDETFPKLISFLQRNGAAVPKWLSKKNVPCPWESKKDFDSALNSKKMIQVRSLLKNTIMLQALYIAKRLERSLPNILSTTSLSQKEHVNHMFNYLSKTEQGVYALIDYVNFKGEGITDMEYHRSGGWGLKQVLQGMPKDTTQKRALWEFVRSAKKRLLERVLDNPNRKNERRWLIGWKKRLDSYLAH